MSAIVVIPARFASTRFPGKPLASLKGLPVIQHVYQNSLKSSLAKDVIVATDSEKIFETVHAFGGKAVMTSKEHLSGTDRIAEAALTFDYDIIVNVQGDEPMIKPEMIDDVITLLDDKNASIGTLAKRITDPKDIFDPNIVKVVFDSNGFAFYFSRAPIPFYRDEWQFQVTEDRKDLGSYRLHDMGHMKYCFKHIGIYSYRKDVLLKLSRLTPSRLEIIEKLEQLRAIENGYKIKIKETTIDTIGVDTREDLERIERCQNISL